MAQREAIREIVAFCERRLRELDQANVDGGALYKQNFFFAVMTGLQEVLQRVASGQEGQL